MRQCSTLLAIIAIGFVCLIQAVPAHAQATRTWISGVGDDANPCSRTAPCKTFAGAISKTAMFGEINCLDPGGYGTVTITKSITLDCQYTLGSILNAGVNGVTINYDAFQAVDTRKTVRLHGIAFNGANSGLIGVRIIGSNTAGSAVFIENCLIDGNFAGSARGVSDERSGGGELYITNTTIRNNGGTGVAIGPASGSTAISVSINNVRVQNSNFGLATGSGVNAAINNSVFSGNTSAGISVGATGTVAIDRSVISGNGTGLIGSGTTRVSNSDIAFNTTGISGTVQSFTNNRLTNNGAGGTISVIGATSNPTGQQ
jgi:hypothetical protein